MDASFSINALEADLKKAQGELGKATTNRMKAQEIEGQWLTEVTSLQNLIHVRKQRLGIEENASAPAVGAGGSVAHETPVSAEISRVAWIEKSIRDSGSAGISPPGILRAAEKLGVKMHPNYPYVVLKKLIGKGTVTKKNGRYYGKES